MNLPPTSPRRRATARRLGAALTAVVAVATATSVLAVPAEAARPKKKADLVVVAASTDRTTVLRGGTVKVSHTVRNKGRKRAGASTTRFYLSTNAAQSLADRRASRTNPRTSSHDRLLAGAAAVYALKPRRKKALAAVVVTVPATTPTGTYALLACADDRGRVKEAREDGNCRVVGALRVTAPPASPMPEVDASDLELQTFAETTAWPDEESGLSYVKALCKAVRPVQPKTLAAAIASSRATLESVAPGGVAKVAASPLAATAADAQSLAASATTQGSPGLALAALLRAHDLEPTRAAHLVNAASVANTVGLPNEAIAFLDAAKGLEFRYPAASVPQQATMDLIRGNALALMGEYDAARPLFAAAKQLAPLLSEADTGLATVAACKGQDDLARRYLRRSRSRADEPVPAAPPTEDPVQPEPDIDVTRGLPSHLRQLQLPGTPSRGVDLNPVYKGIQQGFSAEIDASNQEGQALRKHLWDTDDARTAAEIDRRDSILSLVYLSVDEGEVEDARNAFFDKVDELTEAREEFWGGGTGEAPYTYDTLATEAWAFCKGSEDPDCWIKRMNATCRPALSAAHNEYKMLLQSLQDLGDHYLTVWSKRMSGLAANLIDEEAHRLALLAIEDGERGIYANIVSPAQAWTLSEVHFRKECVEDLPPEVADPPETRPGAADPGKCPTGLKVFSFKVALGPVAVKINCERVESSVAKELAPLLAVFADSKYDYRTGNTSVWIGAKGGGKLPGGIFDAVFKSGIYLKVDPDGNVVDAGWRVGPSAKVAGSNLELTTYKDEIDLSFTDSLTPGY